ncbi:putative peptide zinc metalloprotease protein [Parafrankia irregularis]|uniref:Putative peptide zinc metalloprotease protein n=1 Tax=Parafrankia irregularis TaxID=795642 RepID=A0A0S4QI62_9ACTN|nr:putative peptide zinc metalloprotease protein [Parafrankia irregularis]
MSVTTTTSVTTTRPPTPPTNDQEPAVPVPAPAPAPAPKSTQVAVADPVPRLPVLAAEACLHPPVDVTDVWVAQIGPHRYIRVGADAAALLSALDGERDVDGLVVVLGAPWTAALVERTLRAFVRTGLVVDAADLAAAEAAAAGADGADGAGRERRRRRWLPRRPRLPRRVSYQPPLSIQLTLVDPSRVLGRFRPALRRLMSPVARGIYLAITVAGLGALAWQGGSLMRVVSHPLGLGEYGIVLGGLLVVTGIHELGHAAVLTALGGRPRRLGVMLFYLTPAFFCDISDGWRLRHNRYRVATALAGVAVQWVCAGVAALVSLGLPAGDVHDAVVALALACYIYGVFNLTPFVKFDGYIALMSHLDIPHLRKKSMADARRAAARFLFGGRYRRELPRLWWSSLFGLCCILFPVYLVGLAAQSWLGALVTLGPVGAAGGLALIAAVIVLGLRAGWKLLVEARENGAGIVRISVVSVLIVALCAAAALLVEVPRTVRAGYLAADGRVLLVLPDGTDPAATDAGHRVDLLRTGLLAGSVIAGATTSGVAVDTGSRFAPMGTAIPVRGGPETISATFQRLDGVRLEQGTDRLQDSGLADIHLDRVSVGGWLIDTYVAPAVRSIIG